PRGGVAGPGRSDPDASRAVAGGTFAVRARAGRRVREDGQSWRGAAFVRAGAGGPQRDGTGGPSSARRSDGRRDRAGRAQPRAPAADRRVGGSAAARQAASSAAAARGGVGSAAMTRARFAWTFIAIVVATAGALLQQAAQPAPSASTTALLPGGAALVLHAKDLASLVSDWNGSVEKAAWLRSSNYEAFSRSRLFLRLTDAYDEFATAAGIPPDMALLSDVAG